MQGGRGPPPPLPRRPPLPPSPPPPPRPIMHPMRAGGDINRRLEELNGGVPSRANATPQVQVQCNNFPMFVESYDDANVGIGNGGVAVCLPGMTAIDQTELQIGRGALPFRRRPQL
ncbi:hypothetical protein CYLTODRAFT_458715 [Cylindrobasidium torrendii FP15055 ss-10]|uniref:Uncharacterized protein n=1 Tax=Cylindrobasidium torrendii FP15055 ss-10 TaxID=1314674 RepID=A0A0D7AXS8_9AGAR|nr:hypothetical protein CYLTODRAFT_458715 [Cylindrobasidium torrendii FP15055 ss-10]